MIGKQEPNIVASMKDFYEGRTTLKHETNTTVVVRRIFDDENFETKYRKLYRRSCKWKACVTKAVIT